MNMTEGTQPTQRRFTHRMDRPINRPVRGSRSYVYPRDTRRAFGWRSVGVRFIRLWSQVHSTLVIFTDNQGSPIPCLSRQEKLMAQLAGHVAKFLCIGLKTPSVAWFVHT